MLDYAIICGAAFLAGILNTLAGGGTFLTFPALSYIGIPPVMANATSAVAVFPGYLGGAAGFRHELRMLDRKILLRITAVTMLGGLIGSCLLLVSSDRIFSLIVPLLLLLATAIFAFRERILALTSRYGEGVTPYGSLGMLMVAVYGGYFNGGVGIVLLALFSLWRMTDINRMNGLKTALSFILSAVSVTAFSLAGLVSWPHALAMMAASTIGGYLGAPLARALPPAVVRAIIVAVGLVMTLAFSLRALGITLP